MKVTYMEIATASGKRGGVVGGSWKGINWLRKRIIPNNPRTGAQSDNRATLATAVAATNLALANPTTYQTWADWAAANSFRSKNGAGSQFLPPYQSALTVVLNRLQYGFAADASTLPTTTSPSILTDQITVEQIAGTSTIGATYAGALFTSSDQLQFWIAQINPNRKPTFGLARRRTQLTGSPGGATDAVISPDLNLGSYYDVWVSRYTEGAKEAAVPFYVGRVALGVISIANTNADTLMTTGVSNSITYHVNVDGPAPTGSFHLYNSGLDTGVSDTVDGSNNLDFGFTPALDGVYTLYVVWAGDSNYQPITSSGIDFTAS